MNLQLSFKILAFNKDLKFKQKLNEKGRVFNQFITYSGFYIFYTIYSANKKLKSLNCFAYIS